MKTKETHHKKAIDVIIPAFNEEKSLAYVLQDLPSEWVRQVIVCNNGSTDATASVARAGGAIVIDQPKRGYGNACFAGIRYLSGLKPSEQPSIIVFLDADYSIFPISYQKW